MKKYRALDISLITIVLLTLTFLFLYGFLGFKSGLSFMPAFNDAMVIITAISIFGLLAIAIIEFLSPIFVKDSDFYTAFSALFVLLLILSSRDFLYLLLSIGANFDISNHDLIIFSKFVNYLVYLSFLYSTYGHLKKEYNLTLDTSEKIVFITMFSISAILLLSLTFARLSYIGAFLMCVCVAYILFKIGLICKKNGKYTGPFVFTSAIVLVCTCIVLAESISSNPSISFMFRGITSILALVIFALFFSIYFYFIIVTNSKAVKQQEYEELVKKLESSVLKNQMAPHYIFNSLNIIKAAYLESTEKGNLAIDLFSTSLRNYVDSVDIHTVSIDKELKNVSSYIEFINLKVTNKFNVIYDIDSLDFMVPLFSIQPFVENSVKYSKVNEKEDGAIEISTSEDELNYYIVIRDNGVGFSTGSIHNNSVGIKNTKERLSLYVNASVDVKSKINEGTVVTITVPKSKETNK